MGKLIGRFLVLGLAGVFIWGIFSNLQGQEKLRMIIETDIGGDPDDQASFVRWLLYINEWDVEGIITTRPPGSRQGHGYTIAKEYIDAYGQVYDKLKLHKNNYPSKSQLMAVFKDGMPSSNAGRDHIISVVDKTTPGRFISPTGVQMMVPKAI